MGMFVLLIRLNPATTVTVAATQIAAGDPLKSSAALSEEDAMQKGKTVKNNNASQTKDHEYYWQ